MRKRRKARGKRRVLRVWALNTMRMRPAAKMGRDARWYSRGWKVYEPNHFMMYARRQRRTPEISSRGIWEFLVNLLMFDVEAMIVLLIR